MLGLPDGIRACLFDLDGVLTQTARVHRAAWKETFDELLRGRQGEAFQPFTDADYSEYVDGKPRRDGVRDFLASRGIHLPEGDPDDPPSADMVAGVGNRKDERLLRRLKDDGVEVYEGSVRYLRAVRERGLRTAVVTASANAEAVLEAAGLSDCFEAVIDGVVTERRNLRGKPAPDTYLAGALALGAEPAGAAVFEDALAGVEAGRAGSFGFVVGVDRAGQAEALRRRGADVVVADLSELLERLCGSPEVHRPSLDAADPRAGDRYRRRGGVDLRPGQRPHGAAGDAGGGRAPVPALPQRRVRGAAAALRRGRVRLFRVGPDGGERHRRQADPAHRRGLPLRRALRRRDITRAGPRLPHRPADPADGVDVAQRPFHPGRVAAAGVVHAPDDRRHRLRGHAPRPGHLRRRPVRPAGQRAGGRSLSGRSPCRRRAGLTSRGRARRPSATAGRVRAPDAAQPAAGGGRDGPRRRGPRPAEMSLEAGGDLARLTVAARLPQGSRLRLVKFLAYGWSSVRSAPALRDQVEGALATAMLTGWETLADQQREFLDEYWERADVELDGDPELQQAVRFALFHLLQAGVRGEQRAIPAKGLTGPGYDGHAFWDTETYVLPVLTYSLPDAVRDALAWRHSTLDLARARAQVLNQRGATFPWRTIRGEECSGYWPAGTAAFHIGADIANATARYMAATEDTDFEERFGADLLIETARLWMSLGHFDGADFRIDGVTGPDECTAVVDDNIYTNLMAQRNLREAAAVAERQPKAAARLGVDPGEVARWRQAAEAVVVPYDDKVGVHSQSEGFTQHAEWDFAGTPPGKYPLLLHHPYFDLYRKQVVKQADLVLAMHLRGDAFTPEEKARNFAYYEARTVRDSSLSACPQGVIAAEVGHLDLAYDYWGETAFTDLHDLHHNAGSGLHIAALAGAWTVAVSGFGGMRDHDGRLTFAPRLPSVLSRLRFHLSFRGRCLRVEIHRDEASYVLLSGDPVSIAHHGEPLTVATEVPVTLPIPPAPAVEPVSQPLGRAPRRRRPKR